MKTVFVSPILSRIHFVRLRKCAATGLTITAIEIAGGLGETKVKGWRQESKNEDFPVHTLFPHKDYLEVDNREIAVGLFDLLDGLQPEVLVVPGWSTYAAVAALYWAVKKRSKIVLLSDSFRARSFGREKGHLFPFLKRAYLHTIVRVVGACLTAGSPHRRYLEKLGMNRESIFTGYDVVDNQLIKQLSSKAKADSQFLRTSLQLPEKFFLTVCRLVHEKNMFKLLEAYSIYKKNSSDDPWGLVIVGDGPLKTVLEASAQELGIEDNVRFAGHIEYAEIGEYYGLASAFILISISETWGLAVNEAMASALPVIVSAQCGCSEDLVHEGENGYVVDSGNVRHVAEAMRKLHGSRGLNRMSNSSADIVSSWDLSAYSNGLQRAIEAARRFNMPVHYRSVALGFLFLLMNFSQKPNA